MKIIGVDLHPRQQTIAMLDDQTGELVEKELQHEGEQVRDFYSALRKPVLVGMEATGSMQWFLRLLEELGIECRVGHPAKSRAAEPRKQKNDRRDARLLLTLLAELLRCDYLPKVWQPDKETQRLRRLTHRRAALVSDRTRLKNRLHSILHHTLVPLADCDLFSKKGIAWLRRVPLAQEEALARASDLRLLELT